MRSFRNRFVLTLVLCVASAVVQAQSSVSVQLPRGAEAASGRLLLYVQPAADAEKHANGASVTQITLSPFRGGSGSVAAMEVARIAPGQVLRMDADAMAYPQPLSAWPKGSYYLQAVLDTEHDNNYAGRGPDDIASRPVKVVLGEGTPLPVLQLDQREAASTDLWAVPPGAPANFGERLQAARPHIRALDIVSPKLSAFWGRPVHVRGWVVLPPGYQEGTQRYPVAYSTHGFGGDLQSQLYSAVAASAQMASGAQPPMIWVYLDQSSPTGTHEFADSVNNGPWGAALTEDVIPQLEREYRMDAKPSGRFVTGHSSGGWAALWLQVRYPKLFGGSWPTAPDPSDFRDFTNIDIYAPGANAYRRADGSVTPLVRNQGKDVASFEQFARTEAVIGPYGGQLASFEWVFSPRGKDGRPMPLFDRATGAIDPQVAAYWRQHYDIAQRIRSQWPVLKPDLDGRIHMLVGTADTFYLDRSARKLAEVLAELGAKPAIRFVPGRDHGDLHTIGGDRRALSRTIAWEMYRVARPSVALPADLPQPEIESTNSR